MAPTTTTKAPTTTTTEEDYTTGVVPEGTTEEPGMGTSDSTSKHDFVV